MYFWKYRCIFNLAEIEQFLFIKIFCSIKFFFFPKKNNYLPSYASQAYSFRRLWNSWEILWKIKSFENIFNKNDYLCVPLKAVKKKITPFYFLILCHFSNQLSTPLLPPAPLPPPPGYSIPPSMLEFVLDLIW